MDISHSSFAAAAEESLTNLKIKQLRTLLLLLAIGVPIPVLFAYRKSLAVGEHLYVPVFSTVLYVAILVCLVPTRLLNFTIRGMILVVMLFVIATSSLLQSDILGSGYLIYSIAIFCTHYFFNRKTVTIVVTLSIVVSAAIVGVRISGLSGLPLITISESYIFLSLTKLFVFCCIAIVFNLIGYQQIDVLTNALKEIANSRYELDREKTTTENYLDLIPGLFILYNEDWEVERWNKNVHLKLGYTEHDLKQKKIITFFDEESRQAVRQGLSEVLVKGESYTEGTVLNKDGSKVPMALYSRKLDFGERPLVCAIATDLSEKRHLEKEVQEAQKMEALGALAGGVAHDLNNVLAGITGYADIVRDTVVQGEMPDLQYIDTILKSCERAAGIVKQILMFSRRSETSKNPVRLRPIIRDAIKLIQHTIPKYIEVVEEMSSKDHAVYADVNQVHQVFMNICTNAWHAMRDNGGTLTVTLSTADIERENIPDGYGAIPGLYQKVSVSDTGTGIPPEVQADIFKPFFTTKPEGMGTGLGLAVVDKIIRSHDGFLTVDTTVGKGATFSIYLPIANQSELLSDSEIPLDLPRGTETILVVDDEPQVREASSIMLHRLGYTVFTAEDGKQGMDLYIKNHDSIQLVITDLAMPRMDGSRLAGMIKKENPTIPILLCTGYSEAMDATEIAITQFSAQIHKPLRMQKLATIVRNLIDGRKVDVSDIQDI